MFLSVMTKIAMLDAIGLKSNGSAGMTFHSGDPGVGGTANKVTVTPVSETIGTAAAYPTNGDGARRTLSSRIHPPTDGTTITHAVLLGPTDQLIGIYDIADKIIDTEDTLEVTIHLDLPA